MARLFGVCQSYHAEPLLETRMKRITFLIAVAFGLAISSASFAQTVVDVVYLKNGSVIRGTIVEQVPGESLKVQTADGSIFVYTLDEVEKMTKEEVEEEEVSRPTGSKKPYQNEDSSFFQQINEQAMSTNASWSSGRRSYRTLRRRF